jgi:hypothetical protein
MESCQSSPCQHVPSNFFYIEEFYLLGLLAACFMLTSCLAFFSSLKIEATYSSETPLDVQWARRCCVAEDRSVPNHCCENLTFFYIVK